MDRYQRVEKPKAESPIQENEIRITTQGLVRNYITYGVYLLQDKHAKEITLKAMGQAISKAVQVVEILKKQFPKLHQDTAVSSMSLTDIWEPIEEGLLPVETTRQVSMISITLSTKGLNKTSPGYQAPNHAEESTSLNQQQQSRQPRASYNAGYGDFYGRGRGRGRGRGWGRGYGDYYQDNHGHSNNWEQGHFGRGRNFYQGDNYNQIAYDQGYDQGHDRGYDQGRGGYERRQEGVYEHVRGGGYECGRRGGRYERGRGGSYERDQGGGYEKGQVGGYERGQGGDYDRGQGGVYERGRGGDMKGGAEAMQEEEVVTMNKDKEVATEIREGDTKEDEETMLGEEEVPMNKDKEIAMKEARELDMSEAEEVMVADVEEQVVVQGVVAFKLGQPIWAFFYFASRKMFGWGIMWPWRLCCSSYFLSL